MPGIGSIGILTLATVTKGASRLTGVFKQATKGLTYNRLKGTFFPITLVAKYCFAKEERS